MILRVGKKIKKSSEIKPPLKDYVILNSGHKMPLRGFGTSNLKAKPFEVKEAVYQALQTGYRYRVDCQNYQGLLVQTVLTVHKKLNTTANSYLKIIDNSPKKPRIGNKD